MPPEKRPLTLVVPARSAVDLAANLTEVLKANQVNVASGWYRITIQRTEPHKEEPHE